MGPFPYFCTDKCTRIVVLKHDFFSTRRKLMVQVIDFLLSHPTNYGCYHSCNEKNSENMLFKYVVSNTCLFCNSMSYIGTYNLQISVYITFKYMSGAYIGTYNLQIFYMYSMYTYCIHAVYILYTCDLQIKICPASLLITY